MRLRKGHTIVRFLARRHGFAGADEAEIAIAESLFDRLSDLRASFGASVPYNETPGKKREREREKSCLHI